MIICCCSPSPKSVLGRAGVVKTILCLFFNSEFVESVHSLCLYASDQPIREAHELLHTTSLIKHEKLMQLDVKEVHDFITDLLLQLKFYVTTKGLLLCNLLGQLCDAFSSAFFLKISQQPAQASNVLSKSARGHLFTESKNYLVPHTKNNQVYAIINGIRSV